MTFDHPSLLLACLLWLLVPGCSPGPSDEGDSDNTTDDDDAGDDDDDDSGDDDDDDSGDDDDDDSGDDDDDSPPAAGLVYAFFAIHLDPGNSPALPDDGGPNPSRGLEYFDDLVDLVEAADTGGHKLTLMFTAQWAAHVLSTDCALPGPPGAGDYVYQGASHADCLDLVRAFETHGHEIAFHHHPEDAPNNWDGFTNTAPPHPQGHLGTVDDLMDWVEQVPVGGIDTLTAGTTEEYPSTHALRFMSARGPTPYVNATERGDLASTPCAWSEDGNEVWRWRMRSYSNDHSLVRGELQAAAADLATVPGPWTAGFITHAKDVDGDLVEYVQLFDALSQLNLVMEGLSTVASHYDWTDEDPIPGGTHDCPADEAL